jgi:ABC-type ATPase involved in cell division
MIERNLNELFPLSQLVFIVAESGYGKSSLVRILLSNLNPDLPVFIQTRDQHEFPSKYKINFLENDFDVSENNFKNLPDNSIVFLDDFVLNKSNTNIKQNKSEFLNVVNYYLRHHNITLFLIVHNIYSNGLLNEILLAPHLLVSYSNLGYYIIK